MKVITLLIHTLKLFKSIHFSGKTKCSVECHNTILKLRNSEGKCRTTCVETRQFLPNLLLCGDRVYPEVKLKNLTFPKSGDSSYPTTEPPALLLRNKCLRLSGAEFHFNRPRYAGGGRSVAMYRDCVGLQTLVCGYYQP